MDIGSQEIRDKFCCLIEVDISTSESYTVLKRERRVGSNKTANPSELHDGEKWISNL